MSDIGTKIKHAREAKNLSIDDISALTKISVAVLKDLENDEFQRYFGEEAYVKMYLKKVARVLELDLDDLLNEYVQLTQEIELSKIEKEVLAQEIEAEKKPVKMTFTSPQFARKPSVYEDKTHLTIIKGIIIGVLIALIIGVIWFGFVYTRSKVDDPQFENSNNATVEGDIDTQEPQDDSTPPLQTPQSTVTITKNDQLDYTFSLNDSSLETFTLKIEFANKSWAELKVNGVVYSGFSSGIYHDYEGGENEVVEVEIPVEGFENLQIRNGYSMGHKYYINDQEIKLEQEDQSNGATTLTLTMESN